MEKKLPKYEIIDTKDIPRPKGGAFSKTAPIIIELLNLIPKGKTLKVVETPNLKATTVNGFLKRKRKHGKLLDYKFTQRKINGKTNMFITHE